jgi:hypothetical protein
MAMAISMYRNGDKYRFSEKGSMRSSLGGPDVVAATEEPTAVAERRLSVETDGGGRGVGGVVVAAAVALPLADAIGDAPVNVAWVGGPAAI